MVSPKKVMGRTRKLVKNPINLTLKSKFKEVCDLWMYATHRLMVRHPNAKYGKPMSNQPPLHGWNIADTALNSIQSINPNKPKKSYGPGTKTCPKPYKFDLKVKVQERILIMNVCNASSHDDTPMCRMW